MVAYGISPRVTMIYLEVRYPDFRNMNRRTRLYIPERIRAVAVVGYSVGFLPPAVRRRAY
jgi:hypothetical protein